MSSGFKTIELSQGQHAIVDEADFKKVSQFKWSAMRIVYRRSTKFYAFRVEWSDWKAKKQKKILLHRFLLDAPEGVLVDHRDGNPLNCRRRNLRLATHSENAANKAPRENMTGFKGVHRQRDRYVAEIYKEGRKFRLGRFATASDAAQAYDAKAKELFGAFARVNFPEEQI